jgi:succinyl-CoA synthetase beta subunit
MVHPACAVQGAELMSKFGINVPPGKAAHTLDEVKIAAHDMKDENNEVRARVHLPWRCITLEIFGVS